MPLTGDGRFRILRPLGTGGSGEVVLAEDRSRPGAPVALKLASEWTPAIGREFAQLARLEHPHVVRVLDFGALADGRLFLTTEIIEGEDLRRWSQGRTDRELALVIAQVCRALQYLHARGIIHGDVKPENILVTAGPTAKLVDFGLAGRAREARVPDAVSGTLRYLAPEVLEGGARSPAADLYSLGASLVDLVPPTSAILEIARWLLAESPAQRPAGAGRVITALAARLDLDLSLGAAQLAGPYFPAAPFVGREVELARLEAVRGTVLMRGGDGVGKSSLLRELRVRALLGGQRCVLGARTALGGPLRGAWAALGVHPPTAGPEVSALDRAVDRLVSALRSAEALLLLDDLRGGDELELRLLARLADSPLRCCATVRDAEWTERHAQLATRCEVLHLAGLGLEEVRQLLEQTLPEHEHPETLVQEIRSATEGNPRLVQELLRSAIEAGQISSREPRYHLEVIRADLSSLAGARLASLDEPTRRTLQQLALFSDGAPAELAPGVAGLEARGLVLRVDETRVRVANRWLREALLAPLSLAERQRAHRGVAADLAALSDRSPQLELELAEQLIAGGEAQEGAVRLGVLAKQRVASLELAEAAQLWGRVAELSVAGSELQLRALGELGRLRRVLGDYAGAIAAHERGLAVADDVGQVVWLQLERAETLLAQGHPVVAIDALAALRPPPGEAEARRRCLWAKALLQQGDHAAAEEQARLALLEKAAQVPEALRADLENVLGLSQLAGGASDEALGCFDRAAAIHRRRGDLHGMARAVNSRGLALQRRGDLAGAGAAYAECLALAEQAGDLQLQTIYTLNAGTVEQEAQRHAEALQHYRDGLALAELRCSERDVARLALNLGNLMVQLGDPSEAEVLLDRAAESARRLQLRDVAAHVLRFRAEAALAREAWDVALALAVESASRLAALQLPAAAAEAELLASRACLARGDPSGAEQHLARARRVDLPEGLWAWALLVEGELALHQSEPRRAALAFEEGLLRARRGGASELLWQLHRRLAETVGEPVDRDYHLAKAWSAWAALLQTIPAPYRSGLERLHERTPMARPGEAPAELDRQPRLRDLLRINRELTREHQPDQVLALILDRAVELVGAERGFVILAEQGKLRVAVARNIDQETLRRKAFKFSRSVAERVVCSGEPVVTGSAVDDERFREVRSVHELQLRSVVCVPLRTPEEVLGALYLDNRFRRGAFAEPHVELLGAFADQATIALVNARLIDEAVCRNRELAEAKSAVEQLNAQLRATVESQADTLDQMTARLGTDPEELLRRQRGVRVVGRSKAICEILRLVDRVATTEIPVLLQGETGTGKEVIARAIHGGGPRRGGPFVSINCSAIPGALLESELFGHARGAFTGAVRDKAGLFQVAAGGTLMLDEVADMPLEMQAKLLRVLQEGRYRRVGEEQERVSDARIISASLHDLARLVTAGRFRQDLYFRLNVIAITVPPLRERSEDIPELVEHILGEMEPRPTLDRAALALLLRYPWPGNVRELQNELRRAATLADGRITPEALSPRLLRGAPELAGGLAETRANAERAAIERALDQTGGSATRAASLLGISRVVLHRKLRKHGIRRRRED